MSKYHSLSKAYAITTIRWTPHMDMPMTILSFQINLNHAFETIMTVSKSGVTTAIAYMVLASYISILVTWRHQLTLLQHSPIMIANTKSIVVISMFWNLLSLLTLKDFLGISLNSTIWNKMQKTTFNNPFFTSIDLLLKSASFPDLFRIENIKVYDCQMSALACSTRNYTRWILVL